MEADAKQRSEAFWTEVSTRLQAFYENHQELKKLLNTSIPIPRLKWGVGMKRKINTSPPTIQQLEAELKRELYRRRYRRMLRSTVSVLLVVTAAARAGVQLAASHPADLRFFHDADPNRWKHCRRRSERLL